MEPKNGSFVDYWPFRGMMGLGFRVSGGHLWRYPKVYFWMLGFVSLELRHQGITLEDSKLSSGINYNLYSGS